MRLTTILPCRDDCPHRWSGEKRMRGIAPCLAGALAIAAGWPHASATEQPERQPPQPDRGRHRHRLRPLVESGGGTAGHGPGAPDRLGQARICSSPDRRKHRRGGHSADAGPQAGPGGRLVRRNGPGSADAHGRGHPCAVRGRMTRVLDWQIEEETARRGPGSARLERRRRRTPARVWLDFPGWTRNQGVVETGCSGCSR